MAGTRRKFDQDFKQGAVRLVRGTGKPVAQVARDLGISEGTLRNWVNADRRRRGDGTGIAARASAAAVDQAGRPAVRILAERAGGWLVQRGVLYGLTQTPMIALLVGFVFKWTTFPVATALIVLPSLILLPVWILHRRRVSPDPDEPSNRFPRLALWAVFPIIVFDLARIPMHYALGNVFWGTWFDFGSTLTGQPPSAWSSLVVGTLLHILQGYVLALGYYVLFRRASLLTALAYLFVGLSVVYSWLFPAYVILGPTPFKWYFVIWWAHLWFALAAWAVARLDTAAVRARLRRPAAGWAAAGGTLVVAVVVFGFVYWRVDTWQIPQQNSTDGVAFAHLALAPRAGPVVASTTSEGVADYRIVFRLGPRDYKSYSGTRENLGAQTLHITGDITTTSNAPVAFCSDTVPALPSAGALATPATFASTVQRLDYTAIAVTCVGPAASLAELHGAPAATDVDIRWMATATLQADRDSTAKTFGGTQAESLTRR
jgi:transposase-like protein